MHSSDSEDDYYGNTTKRLRYLRNKYSEDKIGTENLLKDSVQPDLDACCSTAVKTNKMDDSLLKDDSFIDSLIHNHNRNTRAQKLKASSTNFLDKSLTFKKKDIEAKGATDTLLPRSQYKFFKHKHSDSHVSSVNTVSPKKRSLPQKARCSKSKSRVPKPIQDDSEDDDDSDDCYVFRVTPKKRSLPQRARGKRQNLRNVENINLQSEIQCGDTTSRTVIPTYSIGNTDEYPDLSENGARDTLLPKSQYKFFKHKHSDSHVSSVNTVSPKKRSLPQKARCSKSKSRVPKPIQDDSEDDDDSDDCYVFRVTPKKRSLPQRARGKRQNLRNVENINLQSEIQCGDTTSRTVIPTYSIGNTDEYPDLSENGARDTLLPKSQYKFFKHKHSDSHVSSVNTVSPKKRSLPQKARCSKSKSRVPKPIQDDSEDDDDSDDCYVFRVTPKKRSLPQRARGKRQNLRNVENINLQSEIQCGDTTSRTVIPTYSIGNTDEYPDLSENVQLFNTKPVTQVFNDSFYNEELSVKVYWRSSEIVKFSIRKNQNILQIFEFFAKKENVTTDKLLFLYNDRILKPYYTPDKINYKITKFIEGGMINSPPILDDSIISQEEFGNGLKLKFQCQNVKKPFVICVQKKENLLRAMVKCAEHFKKPLNALKFVFDGDAIADSMTPEELDFEGDECIDVYNMTMT